MVFYSFFLFLISPFLIFSQEVISTFSKSGLLVKKEGFETEQKNKLLWSEEYTYNNKGLLRYLKKNDYKKNTTAFYSFEYDLKGKCIKKSIHGALSEIDKPIFYLSEQGQLSGNFESYSIYYRYSDDGKLLEKKEDSLLSVLYEYNDLEKIASILIKAKDQIIQKIQYLYHPDGSLQARLLDDGLSVFKEVIEKDKDSYTIKKFGIKNGHETFLGQSEKSYHSTGSLETLFEEDEKGKYFYGAQLAYGEKGELLASFDTLQHQKIKNTHHSLDKDTVVNTPIDPSVKKKIYNSRGQNSHIFFKDGSSISFKYNLKGDLQKIQKQDQRSIEYERDSLGRIKKVFAVSKQGKKRLEKEYFYQGDKLLKEVNRLGEKSLYSYNLKGQMECLEKNRRSLSFSYDSLGRMNGLKEYLDENFCYNSDFDLDQKQLTINSLEGSLEKEKLHILHPENREKKSFYTFEKDLYGRVICVKEKEKTLLEYRYNKLGELVSIIKPDGVIIQREYDEWGRLSHLYSSDQTINYYLYYDDYDRLIKVDDQKENSVLERSFEGGFLTKESFSNGLTIEKIVDPKGRVNHLILPDRSNITYHREGIHLKEVVRFSKEGKKLYTHQYQKYDSKGRPIEENCIFSLGSLKRVWTEQGELVKLHTPYFMQLIDYENQKISSIKETREDQRFLYQYNYDQKGWLKEEKGRFSHRFSYDQNGNRLACNGIKSIFNSDNQQIFKDNKQFFYDRNGGVCKKQENKKQTHYSYDALNRLIAIEKETQLISYSYDLFNRLMDKKVFRRIGKGKKWNLDKEIRFFYDGFSPIGSVDETNKITSLLVKGVQLSAQINTLCALELNEKIFFPVCDYRGNIEALYDQYGFCVESYGYSAFALEKIFNQNHQEIEKSALKNPWLFQNKFFDEDSGFIYFGMRFYDQKNGRWTHLDPLGDYDGKNRYLYLANDPINFSDPQGLLSFPLWVESFTSQGIHCLQESWTASCHAVDFMSHQIQQLEILSSSAQKEVQKWMGEGFYTLSGGVKGEKHIGCIGNGEIDSKVRITFLNGLLTTTQDLNRCVEWISSSHGGVNIHYSFRPTFGWSHDVMYAVGGKLGFVDTHAPPIAELWKRLIEEMGGVESGGQIIHYTHSMGGTDSFKARSYLTKEEQKMIRIISFGSSTLIPEDGFGKTVNYISYRDGVPLFDPVGYFKALTSNESNVVFLGTPWGCPLVDHLFSSDTYKLKLEEHGQAFVDEYGALY